MKKKIAVALLALMVVSLAAPTMADRYRRSQNDNPFRLIAYLAHPIGLGLEYAVMRPMHYIVSQPNWDVMFGHKAYRSDDGTWMEWSHGDYSPSIAVEMPAKKPAAKM